MSSQTNKLQSSILYKSSNSSSFCFKNWKATYFSIVPVIITAMSLKKAVLNKIVPHLRSSILRLTIADRNIWRYDGFSKSNDEKVNIRDQFLQTNTFHITIIPITNASRCTRSNCYDTSWFCCWVPHLMILAAHAKIDRGWEQKRDETQDVN